MKLKWFGSGTGAGMYLDLYEVEGGREIVIGAHREEDKPSREDVIKAFASLPDLPVTNGLLQMNGLERGK